ncbi:hypothetical protein EMIHUDRAFT_243228 [Emiliania huxleyi CCMP1516]|uniref:Uncharacterized protein n=2 Tax=Emiliania huxleyi TaxID=2903 RepID=A0A0D3J6M6_EMIH1|nr:hypothetical protein EMIHUDRAFT_243228 [Emiliania huxleyi CCMP1516]EOD19161.1 hypothetical protein EMIHUDRAFT_243228 [Emiliania huxleyi CCMP1516]|eukprot:XP_005771590.1 hypothetical protein EMIHUDRAFT_243228 [Emiliania huxleyi CCMP1516]
MGACCSAEGAAEEQPTEAYGRAFDGKIKASGDESATLIQSALRGFMAREGADGADAATLVQSALRGYMARDGGEGADAATLIQSALRGYMARDGGEGADAATLIQSALRGQSCAQSTTAEYKSASAAGHTPPWMCAGAGCVI